MRVSEKEEILNKCKKIIFSNASRDGLSISLFLRNQLELLFNEYGYGKVIGSLAELISQDEALNVFGVNQFNLKHPRIKTIATFYYKGYNGGVERVQAELINLWISLGYRVVFISEEGINDKDYKYNDSVKRIIVPSNCSAYEYIGFLDNVIEQEKIDVYVNHAWVKKNLFWEILLCKYHGIPFINYVHSHYATPCKVGIVGLEYYKIYKYCDLMIALSEVSGEFFQLCNCRTYLIQNPVPVDLLQEKSYSDTIKKNHILYVGRLSEEKSPLDLVKILYEVKKRIPDAILDVFGTDESDYIKQMSDIASNLNVADSIVFHGYKSETELSYIYQQYPLLLFTSNMEGYPMVLLESKAYGLPVVMYELPYLTLTKDKKGILTASVGDINAMSDSIVLILNDEKIRRKLSDEAKESFKSFKSYDLGREWRLIFQSLETGNFEANNNYYDPCSISGTKNGMLPVFINTLIKGFRNIEDKDREKMLGKKVLFLPRFIKRAIKRVLGKI